MALLALSRKKQALAPDVKKLVKSLTGFEDDEHIHECENYVFSHFLHYQQPMVDGLHVQRSIDGLVTKFTVHGFPEKGKRLKNLVDKFITSALFKDHMQTGVEWYVLQLMVNLAYKPTFTTMDDNPLPLLPLVVVSPEESFNWGAYLKEGWEKFQLPDDDESDEGSLSNSEEEEVDVRVVNIKELKSEGGGPFLISSIPNPCTWKNKTPPIETKKEAMIKYLRGSSYSKDWLRDNVQNSWWDENTYKENVTCKLKTANFNDIWKQIDKMNLKPTTAELVISEYKVLRQILWMFQDPTNTIVFSQEENGKHKVNSLVTIPSLTQDSLQEILTELCLYFDKVYDLKQFRELLKKAEEEDMPPPYTYKVFCTALMEELDNFTQLVVEIETKVDKQDQSNTIISVMAELNPGLCRLKFLHEVYKTCVTDWRTQSNWVCSTRLLSVLYAILLTQTNNMHLTTVLHLFIASFSEYLNIIDVWLCEGRLEDWRQEFLVCRNGEELDVMPYETEMKKYGITPASFLSKLVHLVRDAGRSMTHIIKLDKLKVLKKSVHNKGNLFKEFVENVNQEFEKLHVSIHQTSVLKDNYVKNENISVNNGILPDNKLIDLAVRKESSKNYTNSELCEQRDDELNVKSEIKDLNSKESKPIYMTISDDKIAVDNAMHELTTQQLNDNPFLAEVFKEYLQDQDVNINQNENEISVQFHSHRSSEMVSMLSVHEILKKQLILVYNRHALSAKIVTETLISEYHLIQHFIVLRKVLLMEAGNLIQNFYSFLFKEMADKNWRNARALSLQLVLCIEEEHPDLGANFSVIINEEDSGKQKTPIAEICDISIGYIVEWPVNMVISTDAIASYNSIFSFLLCIKYAFWSLYNLRFSDLNKTKENTLKLRRLFILKMWIQYCVTTIHFYFMGHVLHSYATELEGTVLQATFIDDIIKAHNKFLNAVQEHCLQKTRSVLKQAILQILELCPLLQSLWRLEIEGKLTEDDIAELEDKYMKTHLALNSILELIKENASELSTVHLAELSSEISSSLPESHYESV